MNDFWMSVILTGVLLFLGFLGLALWVWAEQRLQPITEKDKEELLQDIERIKNMKPHQIIIPQAEEWISEEVLQRRKLDAWIAEHVMGWKKWEGEGWLAAGCMDANGIKWLSGTIPYKIEFQPTVDSGQAVDVLKKCFEKLETQGILIEERRDCWKVMTQFIGKQAYGETLELAICLFSKQLFTK